MKPLPYLHVMSRVDPDIERCLDFVASQPLGKPDDRMGDILRGIGAVLLRPESNRISGHTPRTGVELRRCKAAQFVIVYTYLQPTDQHPGGVVSIRAVRHSREADVFAGVMEPVPRYEAAYAREPNASSS